MAWQTLFDRGGISRHYQQNRHIAEMHGLGFSVRIALYREILKR
jgi:hypothetical protein